MCSIFLIKPQVCQVATVVIETTQLVLSQIKNLLSYQLGKNKVSLCAKIIIERCELVKLCHINHNGSVFKRFTLR